MTNVVECGRGGGSLVGSGEMVLQLLSVGDILEGSEKRQHAQQGFSTDDTVAVFEVACLLSRCGLNYIKAKLHLQ